MDERLRFVVEAERAEECFTALAARYGIQPKTGYKWLRRFEAEGVSGLAERSRRPHHSPTATAAASVAALVELRSRHPTWGAKKLVAVLRARHPDLALPAPSTAAAILKREGLVRVPRRRVVRAHPGRPVTGMRTPNAVWTADFKGQFKTRDGIYCFPLTIIDGASRYLLSCRALTSVRYHETRPVFERVFRERGLPERLRTDNGVPFASLALGRLSRLSIWWVRLGILPELIEPGHPEQNGRHERLHRTLKAATARPPARNRPAQQRAFDGFCTEYNTERPHEALGQRPPASVYTPSPRPYPARLAPLEYPAHYEVRLVSANGGIRWHFHRVNVSHLLTGEYVGLEEVADGEWDVYFGPLWLGRFQERLMRIVDTQGYMTRNQTKQRAPEVLPMSSD
jgi:transposase InsO family protein